ncbi:MAG: hypothetical protein C3F07_06790 [Anaerolineales bacterium]|nr:hypothetical protein [Anaerolineae bacterium]PWB74866.1 MAG: hypothetical protein C3F07_06790 [Anaerolineales bacterium]
MESRMLDVERRVKRYWYSDGIAELSSGGMFILLGLYFGIQGYFGEGSIVSVVLQVGLVLIMIGGVFGVRWLVNTLKARITYPRTGYVEYRVDDREAKTRRYTVAAVAMVIAIASMVLVRYIRGLDSMVLITGVLVAIVFIALRGKSSGVTRFYYLGGYSLLLGTGLSLGDLSDEYNLALFYGLLGVAVMVSGGTVLRRYLRENPMPAEADND